MKSSNIFYIFDIVKWGNLELYNQPAELRFFWINSNIGNDLKQLEFISEKNEAQFKYLTMNSCNKNTIN